MDPLRDAIADMGRRARSASLGAGGGFDTRRLRAWLIGALVVLFLFTGFYQVAADEVAVVQRFGKFARIAGPGPHFRLPFGVETITRVPDKRQLKMEFGFETVRAGTQSEFRTTDESKKEILSLFGASNSFDTPKPERLLHRIVHIATILIILSANRRQHTAR